MPTAQRMACAPARRPALARWMRRSVRRGIRTRQALSAAAGHSDEPEHQSAKSWLLERARHAIALGVECEGVFAYLEGILCIIY